MYLNLHFFCTVFALKPDKDGGSHSLVYIFKNNKPICAGGVLADNLILTASSCFQNDQKSGFQDFTIQFTVTATHDEDSKYKIKQVDVDNQNEKRLAIVTVSHCIYIFLNTLNLKRTKL